MKNIRDKFIQRLSQNDVIVEEILSRRKDLIIEYAYHIARTGEDSDKCLEMGFLPVKVHFYQPIPDISNLEKRKVWDKVSSLSGIHFQPSKYLKLIKRFGKKYSTECKWSNEPTSNPKDFYLNNNCFSYGCASALHCFIRESKPRKVIEVGSGHSSKIIRDALNMNDNQEGISAKYIVIDPYSSLEEEDFTSNTTIIKEKVEDVDLKLFKSLQKNDILFIDSSHVSKIGSDVNFEILEVLPILKEGVIIHFHDISLPYEYKKTYATNPSFRMFWTEAYLLQAFLAHNRDFEIVLPMAYIQKEYRREYIKVFPYSENVANFTSGSFWIKKIK